MTIRRHMMFGLAAGLLAPKAFSQQVAEAPWSIPDNDAIRALLRDRVDRQRRSLGVVVGVIEPSGRRFIAYGQSGTARPLDGDTIFQIGSITKVVTTLILSDLITKGDVSLDDPVQGYLPASVRLRERGRPITLRDLATHLSGLPRMPTNLDLHGRPNPIAAYGERDLYQFLADYTPEREPGSNYLYSNLGVALLGRLIARRAGTDYEALLHQRVIDPLALTNTAINLSRSQKRRLTPGHDRRLQPVESFEMEALPASGSLRMSANDVLTLLSVYFGQDTPLAQAATFQMAQPRPPVGPNVGLCLVIRARADGQRYFSASGSKEGYDCTISFEPGAQRGVVVLSNTNADDNLDAFGQHLLVGKELTAATPLVVAPLPEIIRLDQRTLRRFEGRYRGDNNIFAVGCRDGRMFVQIVGAEVTEFYPSSQSDFFAPAVNIRISFDATNETAQHMTVHSGSRDQVAERVL